MIIKNDCTFETNSMFPNSDWYNRGSYVVDETKNENQELIQKIKKNAPYMDLIVENGELVDIIPRPDLRPEPEEVGLEPTVEEILLAALIEIQELKLKVAELEGK